MKKKILALALVIAMLAMLVIGGTLAYFTDTEYANNVLVAGNVNIEIREDNNINEQMDTNIDDGNGNVSDDKYRDWLSAPGQEFHPANVIEKNVWVENTGANDAFVRIYFAVPTDVLPLVTITWNDAAITDGTFDPTAADMWYKHDSGYDVTWDNKPVEIDGIDYTIFCYTYTDALVPGEYTADAMLRVMMNPYVDCNVNVNGTITYYDPADTSKSYTADSEGEVPVLVHARATQTTTFDNALDALVAAFDRDGTYACNPWATAEPVVIDASTEPGTEFKYASIVTNETAITFDENKDFMIFNECNITAETIAEFNEAGGLYITGCEIDAENGIIVNASNPTIFIIESDITLDEGNYLIDLGNYASQVFICGEVTVNGVAVTPENVDTYINRPIGQYVGFTTAEIGNETIEENRP